MNKKILALILLIILIIIAGLWFGMTASASSTFSYNDIDYKCKELSTNSISDTIISVNSEGNTVTIVHDNKEYLCDIITTSGNVASNESVDIVLDAEPVQVFVSDSSGNSFKVEGGKIAISSNGNAVVIDKFGVSVSSEDGTLVDISDTGAVNIQSTEGSVDISDTGAVNIQSTEGSVDISDTGAVNIQSTEGSVDISDTGAVNIQSTEGSVEIDDSGSMNIEADGVDVSFDEDGIDIDMSDVGEFNLDF